MEETSTAAIDPTTTASWSYENSVVGPLDLLLIGTSKKSPDTRPVFGLVLEGILKRFDTSFVVLLGLLVLKTKKIVTRMKHCSLFSLVFSIKYDLSGE